MWCVRVQVMWLICAAIVWSNICVRTGRYIQNTRMLLRTMMRGGIRCSYDSLHVFLSFTHHSHLQCEPNTCKVAHAHTHTHTCVRVCLCDDRCHISSVAIKTILAFRNALVYTSVRLRLSPRLLSTHMYARKTPCNVAAADRDRKYLYGNIASDTHFKISLYFIEFYRHFQAKMCDT